MKQLISCIFYFTVTQSILQSSEENTAIFLKSLGDWDYFKVNVTGLMTSSNVKEACEKAGLVTPCPGPRGCQFSSSECNDTGLPNEAGQCAGWYDLCDNNPPMGCNELRGVYMYYHGFRQGSSCGVVEGPYYPFRCQIGNYYQNKSALCAKKHEKSPLKQRLLKMQKELEEALKDLD